MHNQGGSTEQKLEAFDALAHHTNATAIVTSLIAERLLRSDLPRGVYHLEQLVQPIDLLRQIQSAGIAVTLSVSRP